jgi:hypothetical protein
MFSQPPDRAAKSHRPQPHPAHRHPAWVSGWTVSIFVVLT